MKKKILVTGSTRGIGLQIALKLKKEGNYVVINGRNKKKALQVNKKFDFKGIAIGDLSKENNAKSVVKRCISILGGLDVLICNAGESKSSKPNYEKFKDWKKMFDQNFFSATNIIESSKKHLIKSKGLIIGISSAAGSKVLRGAPITYSTSKAALSYYLKSLSFYMGEKGVRVNIITPGNIMFVGSTWEKKLKKNRSKVIKLIKDTIPIKRFGSSDEVADLVSFLISQKSTYLNGAKIPIDGGLVV